MFLEEAVVLPILRGYDGKFDIGPPFALFDFCGDLDEGAEEFLGAGGKGAIDDVYVLQWLSAHEEGETYVPVCLAACTENNEGFEVMTASEKEGGGEGGAERG